MCAWRNVTSTTSILWFYRVLSLLTKIIKIKKKYFRIKQNTENQKTKLNISSEFYQYAKEIWYLRKSVSNSLYLTDFQIEKIQSKIESMWNSSKGKFLTSFASTTTINEKAWLASYRVHFCIANTNEPYASAEDLTCSCWNDTRSNWWKLDCKGKNNTTFQ